MVKRRRTASLAVALIVLAGLQAVVPGVGAGASDRHRVGSTRPLRSSATVAPGGIASAYLATDLGGWGGSVTPEISRLGAYVMWDPPGAYPGSPAEQVYDVSTGTVTTASGLIVTGPGGSDRQIAINDSGDIVGSEGGEGGIWTPGGGFSSPPNGPDTTDYHVGIRR